jgi:ParB family chromosome partitioning protein
LAQERARASGKTAKKHQRAIKDPDTAALEKRLSDALGLAVTIEHRGQGGVLTIRYRAVEQLDEVIRRLETSLLFLPPGRDSQR